MDGTPMTQNGFWNVTNYVREAGLQGPYAAALFTVEAGSPSVGVSLTTPSPINTASLSSAAAMSTGAVPGESADKSGDASASRQLALGSVVGALAFTVAAIMG
jgi:hypothetical protein